MTRTDERKQLAALIGIGYHSERDRHRQESPNA